MSSPIDPEHYRAQIDAASRDAALVAMRFEVGQHAALTFASVGREMHVAGEILGPDRVAGTSPFGHGSDETVAFSTLLQIGGQLLSASCDLISDGRVYAGAALIRQLVEVEYLAWAFETRDNDAERWLRSDRKEREAFFAPAKLRKAADGKFRSQDYGYHCEFGGHPVPGALALFQGRPDMAQLLLCDALSHTGRIWDHFVRWSKDSVYAVAIARNALGMSERFKRWRRADLLANLPLPP